MNKNNDKTKAVFEWLEAMVVALAAIILLFTFCVKIYTVNGGSMNPTLMSGSRIVISSFYYTPKAGDIVVVDERSPYGESLVKRVIATENQEIVITHEGAIIVDGVIVDTDPANYRGNLTYPVVVPEGYCFLMGDNRSNSYDSRFSEIGFIKDTHIMGELLFVLYGGKGQ